MRAPACVSASNSTRDTGVGALAMIGEEYSGGPVTAARERRLRPVTFVLGRAFTSERMSRLSMDKSFAILRKIRLCFSSRSAPSTPMNEPIGDYLRAAILSGAIAALSASPFQNRSAPLADHHQHLFSPAIVALIAAQPMSLTSVEPISADDLIPLLDAAGIARAVVLSTAYMYGSPSRTVENEYEKVKAENDWTSNQIARFPKRLLGFCSFNPLKEYAMQELERCARDPQLRHGLKMHFGNSGVDYHNPQHVSRLKEIFAAANRHGMTILVHMRASITRKLPYGRPEALIFLKHLMPAAPDVPIQIAHLAGAGGYGDRPADDALAVFAEAIEKDDPRTRRLWFDVTTVVLEKQAYLHPLIAKRIRQLGAQRILYGSDASSGSHTPGEGWATFRKIPLTDTEFETIAANVPPYMR